MINNLFYIYYASIVIAAIAGIVRYRGLDIAMRMIVIMLAITCVSELCAYLALIKNAIVAKGIVYHVYNIIQAFLFAAFFIYAIRPVYYRRILLLSAIFWSAAGILNIIYFQHIGWLNSNMMLLEALCFVTLPLYFIYRMVKDDRIDNIFRHPHFQIALLCLVEWGSTLFFWAFIQALYVMKWRYINVAYSAQLIVEILVALGMAAAFYFYPLNLRKSEDH